MKYLILLIALYFNTSVSGQYVIKLKEVKPLKGTNFYCKKVIDNRIIKSNIGFSKDFYTNIPANFNKHFTTTLQHTFNHLLPPKEDKEALVFIIHDFRIGEIRNKYSFFNINIEIVKQKDGHLFSYGHFESIQQIDDITTNKFHRKNIINGIVDCIHIFNKSDWKTNKGKEIQTIKTYEDYKFSTPQGGLYYNFSKLAKNEPYQTKFKIRNNKGRKYTWYYLFDEENNHPIGKEVTYFSDGNYIYLPSFMYRSDNGYFIRSKHIGRYIYFEDRGLDGEAFFYFGLIGGLISNRFLAIIIDTTTGIVTQLKDKNLKILLANHPKILKKYLASKRKRKDVEAAIVELNSKFILD